MLATVQNVITAHLLENYRNGMTIVAIDVSLVIRKAI